MAYTGIEDKVCPAPTLPNSITPQDCDTNISVYRLIAIKNDAVNPFATVAEIETESEHDTAISANTIAYTPYFWEYKGNPGDPVEENSDNQDSIILDAARSELVLTFSGLTADNEEALKEIFNYQNRLKFWIVERSGKTLGKTDGGGIPQPFVCETSYMADRELVNTSTTNKNTVTIKLKEGELNT